ncbi:unnamed protein product [Cylicostephanus goldi]|uniref:Uncharacterized protein n=1 Tax=Cylicostephanus goldi TaxID=71465 RepID=A0A3P7NKK0_CYLGO|nr:unnamed protein product [Cylicostephanus goldi]
MADSPNSSGAPESPNQFDPASPGYDPASPPQRSVSSNNSDAGTPSHVSAPSSPLSAHAE